MTLALKEQFLEEQNPARAFAFVTDDDPKSPIHLQLTT
jgi:hypothetical protein